MWGYKESRSRAGQTDAGNRNAADSKWNAKELKLYGKETKT